MNKVNFYNADKKFVFNEKKKLKSFIAVIFRKEEKIFSSINYIFCSDEYLLNINKDFLQHDYYTDVITFNLTEPQTLGIAAEAYISLDRIKENAQTNKVPIRTEILRVTFHAVLHLCGYNDKKKSEILIMRQKEEYYLSMYAQK